MSRHAVFDLGTMSTRALVHHDGEIERHEMVTRLGDGLTEGGRFDDAALERVAAALRDARTELDARAADGIGYTITAVATAAARKAADPERLVAVVADTLGVDLRILDEDDEGRLAFAGATADLDHDGAVLVVDIGGGSTEFTVGSRGDGVLAGVSVPVGALAVTQQYLHHDPPRADELSAALSVIELHLDDVVRIAPQVETVAGTGPVLLLGGTAATAAAVEIGLAEPSADGVDGFVLDKAAAEDVFRTLATETSLDRAHNPGLPADRVDVIVGGLCVLVEAMRTLDIDAVTVSSADLLDGVLAEVMS